MKRTILIILALLLLLVIAWLLDHFLRPVPQHNPIDLGEIPIKMPAARAWLKQEGLRVRAADWDFRPIGSVSVVDFTPVSDPDVRSLLGRLMDKYNVQGQILYLNDMLLVKGTDAALWVNRVSGAFKMTQTRDSMTTKSGSTPQDAVQAAINHVVSERLVTLQDGETLDLLFASEVRNAVEQSGEGSPVDTFVSDRYVGFGRRYEDIPIVGSEIVVRLDGHGRVAMVKRNWRQMEQVRPGEARTVDTPLVDLLYENLKDQSSQRNELTDEKSIQIVGRRCGYVEAPPDYAQRQLRPGCEISFRTNKGRDEALSQLWVPLETKVDTGQLLGRRFDGHIRY